MIYCEHFIFTSAKSDKKDGYQIISKSSGVNDELISQLENYLSPTGLTKFSKSKSLLIIKDKVIFLQTKNIAIGHDGRTNIIYTHGIIIDIIDYEKLYYDSKSLEKLFIEDLEIKHLSPLKLDIIPYKPNFDGINTIGIEKFESFFKSILAKKKIVIFNIVDLDLIQNLLTLLPPPYRLISFSTLIATPSKQSKFELVQAYSNKKLFNKYVTIDLSKINIKYNKNKTLFDQCFSHLIQIINECNTIGLTTIYNNYESLLIEDHRTKLILSTLMWISDSKKSCSLTNNMIHDLIIILEKMSSVFIDQNFKIFKKFFPPHIINEYEKNIQINNLIIKYQNKPLMFNTIIDMLSKLNTDEKKEMLFHKLIKLRLNDLKMSGTQIVKDMIDNNYNFHVIGYFLQHDDMHDCIINAFNSLHNDHIKKKKLYMLILKNSLENNGIFLDKLFALNIFDLSNHISMINYYNIINELFTTNIFYEKTPLKYIMKILQQIYDMVINSPKSSNDLQMCNFIFQALLNITTYLLSERNYELIKYGSDLIHFKQKIEQNVNNQFSHKNNYDHKFDIFHPIPSSLIRLIFPSILTRIDISKQISDQ